MKIMIAGSRSITDFDISPYIPDGVDLIISGYPKIKQPETCFKRRQSLWGIKYFV